MRVGSFKNNSYHVKDLKLLLALGLICIKIGGLVAAQIEQVLLGNFINAVLRSCCC